MELCEWKHWEKGMYEPFESQNRQRNETVSKTRGRCLQIEDDAQSWLVSIPFQSSRKGSQMIENHALPFRHHGGPMQAMRCLINKQVVVNSMSDLFGEYNSLLFLVVYSGKRNNSELSSTRKNWLDALVTTKKNRARERSFWQPSCVGVCQMLLPRPPPCVHQIYPSRLGSYRALPPGETSGSQKLMKPSEKITFAKVPRIQPSMSAYVPPHSSCEKTNRQLGHGSRTSSR